VAQHITILKMNAVLGFGGANEARHKQAGKRFGPAKVA
jgi:hypothetical protein